MKHYSPSDYPFNGSIGQYLGRSALLKDRLLDLHLAQLDITAAQFKVLVFIFMGRASTPADLCRQLAVDSGSMTRMLDRLEKKGLLLRQRCEEDRRSVRLHLSEQGLALSRETPRIVADAMNELTSPLTAEELGTLLGLLGKILQGRDPFLSAGDPNHE
ncbi:MarR family winged helix-turn-helix transcriptional regulator [Metapseudomonas otitidis]|uniref:MarR family winged helix-turn-helix transcriptional regulator n=1 Tax=Metapseudomonas otitidis TaxID=319939 RepID=UPI001AAF7677|nr:MarR family transcriptional regulator [Pseudomonas otitidis]MBO2929915.1 MarR family transcriptional regulator [Pseudomonas otitidis]